MSAIIQTGINIVATGLSPAISSLRTFGTQVQAVGQRINSLGNGYEQSAQQMQRRTSSLTSAMSQNWGDMYNSIARDTSRGRQRQEKELKAMEKAYDKTYREIGNKYQSMVMGSVALSMSGVGIKNAGMTMLGGFKESLDTARDFETVMSQIAFYGKRSKQEIATLKKEIMSISYDLPQTATEIADSVLQAQKLGYDSIPDAIAMAKEASKIGFMSLDALDGEESLKFISQIRKQFQYVAEDGKKYNYTVAETGKLTDKLAKTADVSAASIDSLWKTFQSSRTAYASLNTDDNNFLTLMGVMSDRLTPKNAGMALGSFGGGVQMAEKAGRENRGTRGEYYNQLTAAMGGKYDDYAKNNDLIGYIQDVAEKSKELWGSGTERAGILQSMFGKSAVDLFYAYDQYAKDSGKSMRELRDEIGNADGHAQGLLDTIMNTSYGTEKKLEAMIEQFKILFGSAIRPGFNAILDGITKVLTKVNQFMEAHPKLAKVLGYGVGITGLLMVAGGAAMLFVGAVGAIYASIANLGVMFARHLGLVGLVNTGYSSVAKLISSKVLGAFTKLTGATSLLYFGWKYDLGGIKSQVIEWYYYLRATFGKARDLISMFNKGERGALNTELFLAETDGLDFEKAAAKITKGYMIFKGVQDMWGDDKLSKKNETMLGEAGLLTAVNNINTWKNNIKSFWDGFIAGMKDGFEFIKTILEPLKTAWEFVRDKAMEVLQSFGFFTTEAKDASNEFENWGLKIGKALGLILAIRVGLWAWGTAFKAATAPFRLLWRMAKGIKGTFSAISKLIKGLGRMVAPKWLRNMAMSTGRFIQQRFWNKNRQGTHTQIRNARQQIDPTTGKPTGRVTYGGGRPLGNNTTVMRNRQGQLEQRRGGFLGRMSDWWNGRQLVAEQRTTRNGRTQHYIPGRGITNAQGQQRGQQLRTRGMRDRIIPRALRNKLDQGRINREALNRVNFLDAGMDYDSSRNRSGHRRRSIGAAFRGAWNRARRTNIQSGGGLSSRVMEQSRQLRGGVGGAARGGAGRGFMSVLGGATKGVGKMGGTVGKGLLKGLGKVVTKGVPLLFKGALKLIPFLGWALMAWDIISLIFSNWDAIKSAASKAWEWIKGVAVKVWDWVKEKASNIWTSITTFASNAWNGLKLIAGIVWDYVKNKALGIWNAISSWAIAKVNSWKTTLSAIWDTFKTKATEKWNSISSTVSTKVSEWKKTVGQIWDNLVSAFVTKWNEVKAYATNNPITQTIKQVTTKVTSTVSNIKSGVKAGISKLNPFANRMGNFNVNGYRNGLYRTGENHMALLHNGEMVLKNREASILRSMAGSEDNIASTLLEASSRKRRNIKLRVGGQTSAAANQQVSSGDTILDFKEGAISVQVANASPEEMRKGAKKMFEEFKRLVELDNMKNFRVARGRSR